MAAPLMDEAEPGATEGRDFVTALARGLSVMRAFTAEDQDLTLSDLSKRVGLSRATVRRCLLTLQALGYVQSSGHFFRLSPQVLTLAQAYLSSSLLPRVAQPFLERTSEELGQSCSVSVLYGTEVIYVARSARRRLGSLNRDVGTHLPAYCTSMGRVLLGHLPEAELDLFFRSAELLPLTPFTIHDEGELRRALDVVRREGYCLVDQEMEIDLRSLAVPVHNAAGRVVAALHVSTQASRTTVEELMGNCKAALRDAAAGMRPLLVGA
ncbi:IclR family transcriptional regulator domain-containing protein [Muricoccus aerilatus]|uniref:IclR family transcriptional regulator domain-containing protein n=1 Tax=Muricoccus aerilatus TaxID=452982 RepID=UPI0005C161B6|nr:IclR family transcriptional regulator C-terminal domain-containing protein [Roseomonas aerilata]